MDGGCSVPDGTRGGVRSSEVGAQSADADGSLPAEADERFMARAVELARRGAGWTSPNPLVGAVIVRDGRIIGEGWHHRFGGPHAEREALAACSESPAGATAYVTLEPCCHTGKTPPCTEALIEAGIARVVVGVLDPNPLVAGRGNEALRRAGIEVAVGVLEPSCRAVNEPFLHAMEQRRPLVIAKYAMTLDGKVATREGLSRWVTGEAARRRVHEDRHRHAGVMVGIGTALADDPLLTCRLDGREVSQPARVVVDAAARLPLESQLVRTASEAPVIVAVAEGALLARRNALAERGCAVVAVPAREGRVDPRILMELLWQRFSLDSLIVEGGPTLLGSLFDEGLVDRVQAYIAPKIFGGLEALGPVAGRGVGDPADAPVLSEVSLQMMGGDVLLEGRLQPCSPGRVRFLRGGSKDGVLRIAAKRVLGDVRLGDSIAVNGVCLTVTDFDGGSFTADVMPETLRRSNLGMLRAGSPVNLERALVADGRFGGHIVSGHIDGMGTIASVRQEANAVWYEIEAAPSLLRLVVEKGSVALDGISLTVASVSDASFTVSVIPHTREQTTLASKGVGDKVNMENDVIGKYVERLLPRASPGKDELWGKGGGSPKASPSSPGLTRDFLAAHGF